MKTLLEFDHKKATQVINYLAKKEGGQIDKLKLIKLAYFADRYHLRKYGRPITNDTYFAMPLGPVGSSVKDIAEFSGFLAEEEIGYAQKYVARGARPNTVVSVADVDADIFSKSDLEALDFAYTQFGALAPLTVADATHKYPEWDKYRTAFEAKETTREPMTYADFFLNPENGKDVFASNDEALKASQELFEDNFKVAEYWK